MKKLCIIPIILLLIITGPCFAQTTFTNNTAAATGSWDGSLSRTINVTGLSSSLGGGNEELVQVNINMGGQSESTRNFSRYTITLTSPTGTVITIVSGNPNPTSFPNSNVAEFNCKFRDNQYLVWPINGSGSFAQPWPIGYYKTGASNNFSNFNGENPNGNWTLTITENSASSGAKFVKVDLIFDQPFYVNNLLGNTANDDCATPTSCFSSDEIIYASNSGYTNQPQDCYNLNTTGCTWNAAQNNSAWYSFIPNASNVTFTISGITAALQILGLSNTAGLCVASNYSVVSGGCPTDLANDIYPSPRYFNGSTDNMQLNMTGLTIGETYYIVIDGEGGAVSPFYIDITNCSPCPSFTVVADAGPDATICHPNNGGSVVIGGSPTGTSGTAPYTYSWSPTTGLDDPTISNPTATPTSTTTYTVTVTDNVGDTDVDQVTVTVHNEVIATASSNSPVCEGNTLSLSGGPVSMSTYNWIGPNSFSDPTQSPTVSTSATTALNGVYTISVTDANGCSDTETTSVTVNTLPAAGITNNTGTSQLTCSATSISATATGGGTYNWSGGLGTNATVSLTVPDTYTLTVTVSGCTDTENIIITQDIAAPTAGITNNSGTSQLTCSTNSISVSATGGGTYSWSGGLGTNANVSLTSPNTFTVTVTAANGCTDTENITITQDASAPNAAITNNTGTSQLTCATTSISLTATGGGTYLWSSSLGSNASVSLNAANTYTLTVTAANGCTDTESIIISQDINNPSAGITNNSGTAQLTCTTTSISLTATGGGNYNWSSSLGTNASVSVSIPNTYTVTVTATNGCTDTESIIISQDITSPSAGITNNTGTTQLTCTTTSVSATSTGGGTYSWSGGLGTNASVTLTTPDTYTVTVTAANGCTDTESITISQDITNPVAGITNNSMTTLLNCTDTVISVTATGGGTYLWSNGLGTFADTSIVLPGTYFVTVTSLNGCTDTDSITVTQDITPPNVIISNNTGTNTLNCTVTSIGLTASGGVSYDWSGFPGNNPSVNITSPGTYSITVTAANGCKDSASTLIFQDTIPPIAGINNNSGTDTLTCLTTSIDVTATGGGIYNWSGSLGTTASATITSPGIYFLTVTATNGCTDTESIPIFQDILAPAANAGNDISICIGDTTQLNGSGGVTYAWSPSTSLSSASISDPYAGPQSTTSYILTVTAANGCSAADTIIVTVNPLPNANAGSNVSVCDGSSINLTASGGETYAWSPSNGLSDTNIANPLASPATTTTYTVTVTDSNGCSATDEVEVSVTMLPSVDLTSDATLEYIYLGQTVIFVATPAGYTNYDFYNNTQMVQSGPGNTYTTSGITENTTISVIATENGCNGDGDTIDIEVKPIPNAFTPYSVDGVNDVFVKGLDLTIINRWDQVLYQGSEGWDGKYDGTLVSAGTYYYIIKLKDVSDNVIELKGPVTIVVK